jgi:hypothetical protein
LLKEMALKVRGAGSVDGVVAVPAGGTMPVASPEGDALPVEDVLTLALTLGPVVATVRSSWERRGPKAAYPTAATAATAAAVPR